MTDIRLALALTSMALFAFAVFGSLAIATGLWRPAKEMKTLGLLLLLDFVALAIGPFNLFHL